MGGIAVRSQHSRSCFDATMKVQHVATSKLCAKAPSNAATARNSRAVAARAAQKAPGPGNAALLGLVAGLASFSLSQGVAIASQLPPPPEDMTPVYFGNGCFWGRQKEFVDVEKSLGRVDGTKITAVVGYAGGKQAGPDGKVCYYYSDPRTVYERLGHAEVVQVGLEGNPDQAQDQFRKFARQYFNQFRKTPFGMSRSDPQDKGPGYRNVVGVPGGVDSPFFKILQEENVNRMELRQGAGNEFQDGMPTENDELNVVWVVDSGSLPFYQAEAYHQFHNGIGKKFPQEYTQGLKKELAAVGKVGPTGCPEFPF